MLPKLLKDAKIEDIKTINESLYTEIFNLGVESKKIEIDELNSKISKESTIRKQAVVLGVDLAIAENIITENKSLEDSLISLIAESKKEKLSSTLIDPLLPLTFEKTAPPIAGSGSEGDVTIDTIEKATAACEKKYSCKTQGDAVKHARRDYPNLFIGYMNRQQGE